jgi:hypothetical protein
MARAKRYLPGGMLFHVPNRSVGRRELFAKDHDFSAFERAIPDCPLYAPVPILFGTTFAPPNFANPLVWHEICAPRR